ncbi:hypothetical protein [Caballeronia sp. TF1N1]|uniref:hypothetical protein n=1 Tax=Caballeronia sp. TF1N1 TaxID=2878153 RepID=UPI001FD03879|nr:hypothetical protein [Caballeronia sp. TF1N1]
MTETPISAAVQKEIRTMLFGLIAAGIRGNQLDEARKEAVLQARKLQTDSAGPAKVTK